MYEWHWKEFWVGTFMAVIFIVVAYIGQPQFVQRLDDTPDSIRINSAAPPEQILPTKDYYAPMEQ